VRDALLARTAADLDLAVSGDALGFARSLSRECGGHFVPLDEEHAIARVVLDDASIAHIDVARMHGDIESDLRRRDLTIDALAVHLDGGEVVDAGGGLADLASRTVRMNHSGAFIEDPLRTLRAARVATELQFEIEPGTVSAIRDARARLPMAAPERRRDELARILATDRAGDGLRLLDQLGLLEVELPEVTAGRGVLQPDAFHAYDVLGHALAAVDAMDALLASNDTTGAGWLRTIFWETFAWCADRLRAYIGEEMSEGRSRGVLLKLGALLHDVAKPETRTVDAEGRVRFFGHADAGARTAAGILKRLRFSAREAAFVATLVAEHLRPVQLGQTGQVPTMRALYRFHRDAGDALEGVILIALADGAAAAGSRLTREAWAPQTAYMNSLIVRLQGEGGIVRAPRLLTGHDIMSTFGIAEGPRIGQLLEAVREAQAAGEVRDREGALALVRAALAWSAWRGWTQT
jgi:putative nucleotidyltransferase with HDIG domain